MAYTVEEQAALSQRFPGLVWRNGEPFTPQSTMPAPASVDAQGQPLDYLGRPIVDTGETTLVPANLTTRFPWEFLALQVGAPGLVAGGTALGSAAFGGGGAAGGASAAPSLSAPVGTMIPQAGPMVGLSAPAAAGGSVAAGGSMAAAAPAAGGGGGMWSTIMDRVGGPSGALELGGKALGAVAGSMTANRAEEDAFNRAQDYLRAQVARDAATNASNRVTQQIAQTDAAQRERNDAFRAAIIGQLAANMGDVTFDRSRFRSPVADISFSGGLRPSAIGELGRTAGTEMSTRGLDRLQNPTEFVPLPEYQAPTLTEPSKASMWERVLSPLAAGTAVLGTLGGR